jgi:hypothetical protein
MTTTLSQFKVSIWEKVSVWQQTTVLVVAESREALDKSIKEGSFEIADWIDSDPEWSTEEHMCFESDDYEVLDWYPLTSDIKDYGNP